MSCIFLFFFWNGKEILLIFELWLYSERCPNNQIWPMEKWSTGKNYRRGDLITTFLKYSIKLALLISKSLWKYLINVHAFNSTIYLSFSPFLWDLGGVFIYNVIRGYWNWVHFHNFFHVSNQILPHIMTFFYVRLIWLCQIKNRVDQRYRYPS